MTTPDPNAPPAGDEDPNKPDPDPAEQDVDGLPKWARDAISKANAEAAKYRTQARDLQPLADKAKELEEAGKTEVQRLTEQLQQVSGERDALAVKRDRLQVAIDKGLTPSQTKRLVGSTVDELAADADEIVAEWGEPSPAPPPGSRQTEHLRPGSGNSEPDPVGDERDLDAIGARMFRR